MEYGLTRIEYEKPSQKLTFYKAFFSPQWKFLIHIILQCLSAKSTNWNELSRTMASTIICLGNNKKFNFSKYILDNMKKNLKAGVKFYMFLWFIQVFVNNQLGDMSHHKEIFVNLSLTKKGRMNEEDLFGVHDLDGDEVFVDVSAGEKEEQSENVAEKEVSTADPVTTGGEVVTTADVEVSAALTTTTKKDDELTLAQTLIEIKAAKLMAIRTAATTITDVSTRPKEKEIIMQEPSETPSPKPIVSSQQPSQPKEKGKAKMVEPKRPLKRKEHIMMDEQIARDLDAQMQADLEEEQKIAKQKEKEANIAMIDEWDNTHAMMDADCKVAAKLQEEER
nr:hypothetical protein [Tanacetum cinerariifolium]